MDGAESSKPGHFQFTFDIASAHCELVADFLNGQLPEGYQELAGNSELSVLRFYLGESKVEKFRLDCEQFYHDAFSIPAPEFEVKFIPEIDWQERFRRETKAVIIAETILVRPTWIERDSIQSPSITTDIVIDPKMAFGVGSHETTQLAICALKDVITGGERVADIGCGSLILSILAAKLGAGFVKAVDNDPVAIVNAQENLRLNQVGDVVEVAVGSTGDYSAEAGSYDIVVANIIYHILQGLLEDLVRMVSDSGTLILSGVTKKDAPDFESALRKLGVTNWSQTSDGDWVCYTCSPMTG